MPKRACQFTLRGIFTVPSTEKSMNPVARKIAKKVGDDEFRIINDFDDGIMTKIWRLSPEIAREYIHVDTKSLEKNYPGIDKFKKNDKYPFYHLDPASAITSKGGTNLVPVMRYDNETLATDEKSTTVAGSLVVKQKGWVVDAWKDKGSCNDQTIKRDKTIGQSCQLLNMLKLSQERKGYQTRLSPKKIEKEGGNNIVKFDLPSIPVNFDAFSVAAAINFPIDFWVRTNDDDEINAAISSFKKIQKSTISGGKDKFKDVGEFTAWANNVFNNGNQSKSVVETFPVLIPRGFDPKSLAVLPTDFVAEGELLSKKCASSPILVDEHGDFVPTVSGSRKKTQSQVFKKTPAQDLRKWTWACITKKDPDEEAVIPVTVYMPRGVEATPMGKTSISIDQSSIDDAVADVATSSWNAVIRSELEKGKPRVQTVDGIVKKAMDQSVETNGSGMNSAYLGALMETGKHEPMIVGKGGLVEGPILERRKAGGVDTMKLRDTERKHRIIAIKTDLAAIGKACIENMQ